ncbi:MAG TPA: histidine phosphatase family protein [Acidimicrobiales bacterium]|nr:histidine phosphatase family protein [Acidimicrobiales bacterium]
MDPSSEPEPPSEPDPPSESSQPSESTAPSELQGSEAPTSEPHGQEAHSVKYLWLLRHAKATPHGRRGISDYDRPLTGRGRRDALALGNRLAAGVGVFGLDGIPLPQIVLTSSAARTAETAALVVEGMGAPLPIESYRSLYQADTETILQYVREIDDDLISAMVVGHNPTIYRLAWELLPPEGAGGAAETGAGSREQPGGRERLRENGFPTCSLAVLVLPIASWSQVAEESASLAGVFSPPY